VQDPLVKESCFLSKSLPVRKKQQHNELIKFIFVFSRNNYVTRRIKDKLKDLNILNFITIEQDRIFIYEICRLLVLKKLI